MKPRFKLLLWLGVVILVITFLVYRRLEPFGEAQASETEVAEQKSPPLEVDTLEVTPHTLIERFSTVGTIQADEQVEIRTEIAGVIKEIRFAEGSRVSSGELLVQLDDATLVAERDRARHRVELARLREVRQQDLLEQGLTSQEDYDLAFSQLNVLEAELRLAEAQLAKAEVRAPFAGVIGLRNVSRGARISPETRIATLQKLDPIKVEFTVPEAHAGRLGEGETVRFRVRGAEGDFEGRVYAIEPSVDRETRSLRARARCANPAGRLLPGAFADVEIVVSEIDHALTVPALAVIPELGSKKVFVLEDGRAAPRLVVTGVRTENEVQVVSGLEPGDRVIVSAIQQLAAGREVVERASSS